MRKGILGGREAFRSWTELIQEGIPWRERRCSTLFMAVVMLFFSFLLFGANLRAQWWIIDDHEIMWIIGTGERLSIQQYVPKLMQTELNPRSQFPRFRPVDYVLKLGEAMIWGKDPTPWYLLRICLFAFLGLALWYVMARWIGLVLSGFLSVFALGAAYWADIVARLGASEIYGAFGLALFVLGAERLRRRGRQSAGWILLGLGTIVGAGSKENFLFLVIPLLALLAWSAWEHTAGKIAWLAAASAVAFSVWIAVVTTRRVALLGADVYNSSSDVGMRLTGVLRGLAQPSLIAVGVLPWLFFGLYILARNRQPALSRLSGIAGMCTLLILAVVLSQLFFYNGDWPVGNRYDFPGMLAWPLALFVLVWYFQRLTATLQLPKGLLRVARVTILMLCLLAAVSRVGDVRYVRQSSLDNVRRTVRFTQEIAALSELAKEHPGYAFVFTANDTWDYEPVFSYPRFLAAQGVAASNYLLWNAAAAPSDETAFQASLSQQLAEASEAGSPGSFEPLRNLSGVGSRCILVVISGPANWPCEIISDGNWRYY